MKILSAALAAVLATAAVGLPITGFAQTLPGPDAHQPMRGDQMRAAGAMHQGDTRGDMHSGDARGGDMHHDNMRGGGMDHGDMRRGDMRGHVMRGHNRGWRHGWHRHCWTQWRHHHRVRVCH